MVDHIITIKQGSELIANLRLSVLELLLDKLLGD